MASEFGISHSSRIRVEIVAFLEEYRLVHNLPTDWMMSMSLYIDAQVQLVTNAMNNEVNEGELLDENPETAEGDLYRELIWEYGNVFQEFDDDDESEEFDDEDESEDHYRLE